MPRWSSSTSARCQRSSVFTCWSSASRRERRIDDLAIFCVGAAIPTLILLGYNQLAFGSPWQMGYFHHATQQFAEVHNVGNPLGLALPESFWSRLVQSSLGPSSRSDFLCADRAA